MAMETKLTISNADPELLDVTLEITGKAGDLMLFRFRVPPVAGEGIADLQNRMLRSARTRIQQLLAPGAPTD